MVAIADFIALKSLLYLIKRIVPCVHLWFNRPGRRHQLCALLNAATSLRATEERQLGTWPRLLPPTLPGWKKSLRKMPTLENCGLAFSSPHLPRGLCHSQSWGASACAQILLFNSCLPRAPHTSSLPLRRAQSPYKLPSGY